jgi:hypothetical protein
MMYRFYNHTPIALVASPDVDSALEDKDEACKSAAAAIFLTLFEKCDPRIYRELRNLMEEAKTRNPVEFTEEVRKTAFRVKEGEL